MALLFTWDPDKAKSNLQKHGVDFNEAATVFTDPLNAAFDDPDHSSYEKRYVVFGISDRGRLLMVAHIDCGDSIRIISAREMTRSERRYYEEET